MQKIIDFLKEHKKEVGLFLLIMVLAFILRLYSLLCYGGFWVDELWSIYFAKMSFPFGVMGGLLAEDIHVPFFFLLLNLWLKVFNSSETAIRLLPFCFGVATLPVFYFVSRKLFNTKTALFATSLLAVSAFHIHYTRDLKYYSLVGLLGTLVIYYFIKLLNEPDKKNAIKYAVVSSLMIWTFNVSFILTLFQAVYALFFLHLKKAEPETHKSIAIAYGAVFIACLYVFITLAIRYFTYSQMLINMPSLFSFDLSFINVLLRDWFSNDLLLNLNSTFKGYNIITAMASPKSLVTVFVPVVLSLLSIYKGLKTGNKNILGIIIPCTCFLLLLYVLALFDFIMFMPRYTILIFPAVLMALGYGLSVIEPDKVAKWVFGILFTINLAYAVFAQDSYIKTGVRGFGAIKTIFANSGVKNSDIVFSPISGNLLKYYWQDNKDVDFAFEKFYNYKSQRAIVFGDDTVNKLNKSNFKDNVVKYILQNKPSPYLEKYLTENYLNNMVKGQKFVLLILKRNLIKDKKTLTAEYKSDKINSNVYNDLVGKFFVDTQEILNKNLKPYSVIKLPELNCEILIFEKG